MKKLIIAIILLLTADAHAELRLNGLFTDNMVLQRNQDVPIWGTATPGATVRVVFGDQRCVATSDSEGAWSVRLKPMKASSDARDLSVRSSDDERLIENILVGDVWLCGGQSNMAQTMKRYLLWETAKDQFSNDQLRLFKIKEGGVGSPEPTKTLVVDPFFEDSWQSCTPEFAAEFSATAGFFGNKLQQDSGVPVGLIYANRGATQVNSWTPLPVLESNPAYARFLDPNSAERKPSQHNPGGIRAPAFLYNGTIFPLAPFAIRGVIWYQGESDSKWPEVYAELFPDMIEAWRELWGYDFPFLFVQLAPYENVAWDRTGEAWAWQREAQAAALELSHTGMATIIDAGEATDIHPQAKNVAGERLAILARKLDDPDATPRFPVFGEIEIDGDTALITIENAPGGLETRRVAQNTEKGYLPGQGPSAIVAEANELKGFSICGEDGEFVPAQATIVSANTVAVTSPEVREPMAVRYGWANFPVCNLYGVNGLPVRPFRTDNFATPNFTGEIVGQAFDGIQEEWGDALEVFEVGDGGFEPTEISGVGSWKAEGRYLYFLAANDRGPSSVRLRVLYYDAGHAPIQLVYDSTSPELFTGQSPGTWKPGGAIRLMNSRQWKVACFDVPDARFSGRCNGADFRLQSSAGLVIGGVYVQPLSITSNNE